MDMVIAHSAGVTITVLPSALASTTAEAACQHSFWQQQQHSSLDKLRDVVFATFQENTVQEQLQTNKHISIGLLVSLIMQAASHIIARWSVLLLW